MSRLSEDEKSKIRKLLLQGRSIKSIGRELGHHFNTIKKVEKDLRNKEEPKTSDEGLPFEVNSNIEDDDFAWREELRKFEALLKEDPAQAHEELMFLMTTKLYERLATGNKVGYAEISMGYAKIFEMTRKYRNEMRGRDDLMLLPSIIKRVEKIEEKLGK